MTGRECVLQSEIDRLGCCSMTDREQIEDLLERWIYDHVTARCWRHGCDGCSVVELSLIHI